MYGLICKDRGIHSPGWQAKGSKLNLACRWKDTAQGAGSHISPSLPASFLSLHGLCQHSQPATSCEEDVSKGG